MAHKVVSDHEMTKSPPQTSYTSLLNSDSNGDEGREHTNENARDVATLSKGGHAKLRDLLRFFYLQFIETILNKVTASWRVGTESRKYAMHRNRKIAASYSLLHLVPVAGAVTLLCLQWTSYWVSSLLVDAATLQFAAKFHELAMQSSIVEILLCLIRMELVENVVPFGALSGAIQATQLSYLWSLDYFSVWQFKSFRGRRKAIFVVALPVLIGLAALVGPSSAVLMIPRSGSPYTALDMTRYANISAETLFPSRDLPVDMFPIDFSEVNTTLTYSYPYDQYTNRNARTHSRVVSNVLTPNTYNRLLATSRTHITSLRSGGHDIIDGGTRTIPTTSSSLEFASLLAQSRYRDRLLSQRDSTTSITMARPIVQVYCWVPWTDYRNEVALDRSGRLWNNNDTFSDILPGLRTMVSSMSDVVDLRATGHNSSNVSFSPIWLPSPEPRSKSSIAVLFRSQIDGQCDAKEEVRPDLVQALLDADINSTVSIQKYLEVTACKISPYWITSEVKLIIRDHTYLITADAAGSTSERSQARAISLDVVGAKTLHAPALTLAINDLAYRSNVGELDSVVWSQASAFAATIAMWLSGMPSRSGLDWHYLNAEEMDKGINASNNMSIRCVFTLYGFGYGTRSTSIYLSMAVLSLYCLVAVIYVLYTWITGTASTAWNSGIELVALALQSRKPDHLGHTGVGINSIRTYAEGVGVRMNKDNELELVFAHDRDFETSGLRKLTRNREY